MASSISKITNQNCSRHLPYVNVNGYSIFLEDHDKTLHGHLVDKSKMLSDCDSAFFVKVKGL